MICSYFIFLHLLARVWLEQKYYAPEVWPNWEPNIWNPDHDSAFHVTKILALTTRLSATFFPDYLQSQLSLNVNEKGKSINKQPVHSTT